MWKHTDGQESRELTGCGGGFSEHQSDTPQHFFNTYPTTPTLQCLWGRHPLLLEVDSSTNTLQGCVLCHRFFFTLWNCLYFSEATHQESWTREFNNWKSVVNEHDQMMQNWKKAWVGGSLGHLFSFTLKPMRQQEPETIGLCFSGFMSYL